MMTMTTQGKTLWAVVLLALSVQEATGFGVNHLQSSRSRRTTIGNNDNTNTNAKTNTNTNTGDAYNRYRSQKTVTTHLDTMAAGGNFFDDFRSEKRQDDSSSSNNNNGMNNGMNEEHHNHHNGLRREASAEATNNSNNSNNSNDNDNKFVTGDDLHRLRHQVLAMRLELRDARSRNDAGRVRDLEKAITRTQQVDAEFVYTVSLERSQLALRNGDALAARRFSRAAEIARSSLPQFQLEGLWVGKYGEDQGYEMINVTYAGDTLVAHKVTSGTKHVPRGAETFRVDLSPQQRQQLAVESKSTSTLNRRRARTGGSTTNNDNNDGQQQQQPSEHQPELSPIELGESAARQWGCKYLQRFAGKGQVASEGYRDSQWMEGQLILVNEYFSFAWVPIGHQVFFGRPTPELVLKLMRDETKRDASELSPARSFLEKCWEETEHIEDDMEADRGGSYSLWTGAVGTSTGTSTSSSNSYYDQEGCFE